MCVCVCACSKSRKVDFKNTPLSWMHSAAPVDCILYELFLNATLCPVRRQSSIPSLNRLVNISHRLTTGSRCSGSWTAPTNYQHAVHQSKSNWNVCLYSQFANYYSLSHLGFSSIRHSVWWDQKSNYNSGGTFQQKQFSTGKNIKFHVSNFFPAQGKKLVKILKWQFLK